MCNAHAQQGSAQEAPPPGELLLIDKPLDWTSFDVVAKVRNTYRKCGSKRKVGHCGTLDPKATGLLIVATGRKTKEISQLEQLDKVYDGVMKLGAITASLDTETPEEQLCDVAHLSEAELHAVAATFIGNRLQQPPMHSAAWHNGRRLYEHARKGEVIRERKAREIVVHRFTITKVALPFVSFELHVSKGAYIRVIADEFGAALGVGGYLAALRRTAIGEWQLTNALSVSDTIEQIHNNASKGALCGTASTIHPAT